MDNSHTIAAFMAIGLQTPATPVTRNAAFVRWENGMVELVEEVIQYAPYADALLEAGYEVKGSVPGVGAYEVGEEFGAWFAGQILAAPENNTAPNSAVCRAKLRALTVSFYEEDADVAAALLTIGMEHFEVIGIGFDASDDATDDRVFWVSAEDRTQLDEVLQGVAHKEACELDPSMKLTPDLIDFELPGDAEALRAALTRLNDDSTGNVCTDCGAEVPSIIGCPDGAEVCTDCADSH